MSGDQQAGTNARAASNLAGADWVDGKFRFPLAKKVKAYDAELDALTFREPTGEDLILCGNPVKFSPFDNPPSVDFDMKRLASMLSRLANVPESAIASMAPKDLTAAAWVVAPFFMPV